VPWVRLGLAGDGGSREARLAWWQERSRVPMCPTTKSSAPQLYVS